MPDPTTMVLAELAAVKMDNATIRIVVTRLLDYVHSHYGGGCPKKDFVWTCPQHKRLAELVKWGD